MLCYAKLNRTAPAKVQRSSVWTLNQPGRAFEWADAFYGASDRVKIDRRVDNSATAPDIPDAASAADASTGRRAEISREKLLEDLRSMIVSDPGSARTAALRLASLLSAPVTADAVDSCGGLAPWQRRKLDRYFEENLARPLRLKKLAELVNLSVSHFNRSFKKSHGVAPHRHIIQLRLKLAQSLMENSQDSLCDIALACGLTDQAHLTKLFRQHVGQTPNTWRRRHFIDEDRAAVTDRRVVDQFAGNLRRADSMRARRVIVAVDANKRKNSANCERRAELGRPE